MLDVPYSLSNTHSADSLSDISAIYINPDIRNADVLTLRLTPGTGEDTAVLALPWPDTRAGVRQALDTELYATEDTLAKGPALLTTQLIADRATHATTSFADLFADFCDGKAAEFTLGPFAPPEAGSISRNEPLLVMLRKVNGVPHVYLDRTDMDLVLNVLYPEIVDGTLGTSLAKISGAWPTILDDNGKAPEITTVFTVPNVGSANLDREYFEANAPGWKLPGMTTRILSR